MSCTLVRSGWRTEELSPRVFPHEKHAQPHGGNILSFDVFHSGRILTPLHAQSRIRPMDFVAPLCRPCKPTCAASCCAQGLCPNFLSPPLQPDSIKLAATTINPGARTCACPNMKPSHERTAEMNRHAREQWLAPLHLAQP